jgi:dephospho-CoA kinase
MIAIAVTGSIGSGKSTVVRLLAERGAETIEADLLARQALEPGSAGFAAAVDRFGSGILDGDGAIDRSALGRIVFADVDARRDLEAIVHPVVLDSMLRQLDELIESDRIVVLELPLLVETGGRQRFRIDGVLVVDVPIDLAVERLVRDRGFDEVDARARIAAQADPGERLRAADFIIMNHGTPDDLSLMVDGAWRWIRGLDAEREGH